MASRTHSSHHSGVAKADTVAELSCMNWKDGTTLLTSASQPLTRLPCYSRALVLFEALSVPVHAWSHAKPRWRCTKLSHYRAHALGGFPLFSLFDALWCSLQLPWPPFCGCYLLCHPRLHLQGKMGALSPQHPFLLVSTNPNGVIPFMSKQQQRGLSETAVGRVKLL